MAYGCLLLVLALALVDGAGHRGGLCVRKSDSATQDRAILSAHLAAGDKGSSAGPNYVIEDEAEAVARAEASFLQTRQGGDDWAEAKAQCTCKQYDCTCSKKCSCNIANPALASGKSSGRRLLSAQQYDIASSKEANLLEKDSSAPPGPANSAPSLARFVQSGVSTSSNMAKEPMDVAMRPAKPKQLDDRGLEETPNEQLLLQKVGAGVANTYTGIEPQSVERFAKLAAGDKEDFGHAVAQPNVFACNCDFEAADIGAATAPFKGSGAGSDGGSAGLDCDCKPETCQCKRHCECKMA